MTMPGPRGDRTLRVVVRELELHAADEDSAEERFVAIQPVGEIATSIVRLAPAAPVWSTTDSVRLA